jgi:ribosomal protein S18 acetylase RimI-like enzyme
MTMIVRSAQEADTKPLIGLWEACDLTRPWNDPARDIAFACEKPESDVLVGELDGKIVASVMVGHDGHRGLVYYVAIAPERQGNGFGRQIMKAAEDWLVGRGVWKMNLLIRPGNEKVQAFYESLGYEVQPRMCMARKLIDKTILSG